MKTAYIYSRVSTVDQHLSPEWQAQICRNYYDASLESKGYRFGGIFHDQGESAYKINWRDRTAGRKLFNVVKPGDLIIVAKMCRAFRSCLDREQSMHFLTQTNIDIAVLDCAMDTSTAAGKFAAGIIALQVQWESDVRSERMRAAHSIRRQRKTPGKKKPPPGWKLDNGQLVPDWKERYLMTEVYSLEANRIRSVRISSEMLTAQGIRRANGALYYKNWFGRAFKSFLNNFPMEGYQMLASERMSGRYIRSQRERVFQRVVAVERASRPSAS